MWTRWYIGSTFSDDQKENRVATGDQNAGNRPNIVLIMTDQQRWNSLGCYGHPVVRTPNLDALAKRGIRFEHAFVPIPLCTPSRACLHTGQYPSRHGIRSNETFPLSHPVTSLPALLRSAGYQTYLAGKDHIFGLEGRNVAFDQSVCFGHGGREPSSDESPADTAVREYRKGLMPRKFVEVEPFSAEACTTARITDYAIEMVDGAKDRPFFLWLSYPDPHPPFVTCEPYASLYRDAPIDLPIGKPNEATEKPLRQQVSQRLMRWDEYTAADVRRIREIYYGMISFIDDQVGRFVSHLEACGQRENTIFIYMSDHGEYLGDHDRIRKDIALYDSLIRIPFFVTWEAGLTGGQVEQENMVESVDVMPTLLEWLGLPIPAATQGQSLVPLLSGQTTRHRDRIFGSYGVEGDAYDADDVADVDFNHMFAHPYRAGNWISRLVMQGRFSTVRTHAWKLVYYANGEGELYHLTEDPNELTNLYGQPAYREIERGLLESLLQRTMSHGSVDPPYHAPEPPWLPGHRAALA